MDAAETIRDRTGRNVSAAQIRKATYLAADGRVTATNLPTVWHVRSSQTYRVIVDAGMALCDCPARMVTCAHVMAVWIHEHTAGRHVRVNAIDGVELSTVADGPDDPFQGLE